MNYISYEKFGVNFVRHAVTTERVAASIAETAGDRVDVDPMPAGPGGIATASATGRIGTITVTPDPGELVRFHAVLPIELDLEIRFGPVANRFSGLVEVPLSLTVRTAEPLTIAIDISPITPSEVKVDLRSTSAGADMLQKVGNIDTEVQAHVARVVNKRLASERGQAARIIDIAAQVDESWAGA